MDHQAEGGKPELNALGKMAARFAEYGQNVSNNLSDSFSSMTVQSWIRLVVIVGGYMLLRPYVMKWAGKGAVRRMEDEDAKTRGKSITDPELTPNEFRGIKEKLYEADVDEGDGTGADWGQKARTRQRQMLKQLLEEEERRRAAENEDADIQEFLED